MAPVAKRLKGARAHHIPKGSTLTENFNFPRSVRGGHINPGPFANTRERTHNPRHANLPLAGPGAPGSERPDDLGRHVAGIELPHCEIAHPAASDSTKHVVRFVLVCVLIIIKGIIYSPSYFHTLSTYKNMLHKRLFFLVVKRLNLPFFGQAGGYFAKKYIKETKN